MLRLTKSFVALPKNELSQFPRKLKMKKGERREEKGKALSFGLSSPK